MKQPKTIIIAALIAMAGASSVQAQFNLPSIPNPFRKKDTSSPLPIPIPDLLPFEKRVEKYNERIAELRKEMEQNYYTLHKGVVVRVEVAFVPVITSYRNGLTAVQGSLPEIQTVKFIMSEKVDVAQAPTKDSIGLAAQDMATSVKSFETELASLLEMLKSLGTDLTKEQQTLLVRANSRFSANMEVITDDWKSFGPAGDKLIKDVEKKRKDLTDQYYKSAGEALLSKALNGAVVDAIRKGQFDEDTILRSLGYSTLSEAPEAIQVWIENGKFWAGLPAIQAQFDEAFQTIKGNIDSANDTAKSADRQIRDIRKATSDPTLRKAIEDMERDHKDSERSGTIEI